LLTLTPFLLRSGGGA